VKLAVFDNYRVGVVEGESLYDITAAVPGAGPQWPPTFMNGLIADWRAAEPAVLAARAGAAPIPLASVSLLAPNPCPIHVVAAPANYRKHIAEMGALQVTPAGRTARQQGFFLKASASVTGQSRGIELPKGSERRFDHESELAVIIGRTTRNVGREDALASVFGYTCLIDVTMRIAPDGRAEERVMRKSFETFTPLGPWIVTADELGDPSRLHNQLFVNGECRQDATTADLIVDVPDLISFVSSVMTLQPGDVIATGTPHGIGPIAPGDTVAIRIERIGEMQVTVSETADAPAMSPWETVPA
jgi:2-keto-4-pentenoate hydratase/2-oxohepta-3-ene-1,7-dioic acid hydratase in catechol pathway